MNIHVQFGFKLDEKTIRLDLTMHIGCFVYQYSKFRMLQFYYDFMNVFVDRRDFQYCAMDTDSAVDPLAAELVFLPETVVGLTAQGYDLNSPGVLLL
jgi:hypothetical protein